jgi:hypothetical protein
VTKHAFFSKQMKKVPIIQFTIISRAVGKVGIECLDMER